MTRKALLGVFAVLLVASGCGTESATGSSPQETPPAVDRPVTPSATPTRPPKTCPPSGAAITVSEVDAALGHRAVVLTLTNCRPKTLTINGYPEVAVLDAKRNKIKLTVAHNSSYMASDPGPTRIRIDKGESVLAAVSWSNTVAIAEGKAEGTYLSVARGKGDPAVVWPVRTDLGTTGKVELTAWCLEFPK